MHGRPRKAPTAKEEKNNAVKGAKLRALQQQFLEFHHRQTYTKEALDVSAKLLEINPEYLTAWNYRKLAVEHLLKDQSGSQSINSVIDEELRVVEKGLRSNFKSYGAWYHRKWVLSKGHSSADRELLLLKEFQKADARNFHAWNYRRFITKLKNIPDEVELQYTRDMIKDDISNYSAWHNRSVIQSHLLREKVSGYDSKENFLPEQYEFVQRALFMEPDKQSGWFYHLWLLDQTLKVEHLSISSWPPNGSDICASDHVSFDQFSLPSDSSSNSETFPVILKFSEEVVGVNTSTVTVECEYITNSNLVWKPISMSKSGWASTWLTLLNFSVKDMIPSRNYGVKISISHSEGIISSSGVCCSHPFQVEFRVHVRSPVSELMDGNGTHRISWSEKSFYANEMHPEKIDLIERFHQLRVSEDDQLKTNAASVEIIDGEISSCRNLLALALKKECKIGKLTLARLLMAQDALSSASSGARDQSMLRYKEVLDLYSDLMKLDPPHFQYYKDEYSLVFLKLELANKESLLPHCFQFRDADTADFLCLRLNGLSLSRIGCIEQLLWVQMLDLSDNELHSTEGLEAMQLLRFLNISRNKISSFSALDSLRLLKSLQVLDISYYNEIGSHPVDTRRYLCASPLSHTVGSDWKSDQFAVSSIEMASYWDAFLLFKGLKLAQIDIVGNLVAEDKSFKSFLVRILPELKWLDGDKIDHL